jgi:hypothetical protein
MEGFEVRVVNRGLVGEPHHYCFQSLETKKIIEFSAISTINVNGVSEEIEIDDSDITHPIIKDILNNRSHLVKLIHIDDGGYEIIF